MEVVADFLNCMATLEHSSSCQVGTRPQEFCCQAQRTWPLYAGGRIIQITKSTHWVWSNGYMVLYFCTLQPSGKH